MSRVPDRDGIPQYTGAIFENEFADRHLLHCAIHRWAREDRDAVAVIDAESGAEIRYQELHLSIAALARGLAALGLGKGDFLATLLPFTVDHLILEYACFELGVIHAPLDLLITLTAAVTAFVLGGESDLPFEYEGFD